MGPQIEFHATWNQKVQWELHTLMSMYILRSDYINEMYVDMAKKAHRRVVATVKSASFLEDDYYESFFE